jgi:hypothetical protein
MQSLQHKTIATERYDHLRRAWVAIAKTVHQCIPCRLRQLCGTGQKGDAFVLCIVHFGNSVSAPYAGAG